MARPKSDAAVSDNPGQPMWCAPDSPILLGPESAGRSWLDIIVEPVAKDLH